MNAARPADGNLSRRPDALVMNEGTSRQVWNIVKEIAAELLSADPNVASHFAEIEIGNCCIALELNFSGGEFIGCTPSAGPAGADQKVTAVHIDIFGTKRASEVHDQAFEIFDAKLRGLYELLRAHCGIPLTPVHAEIGEMLELLKTGKFAGAADKG